MKAISESRYLIGTQSYLKGRISLPARRRPGRDSESVTKTDTTNKKRALSWCLRSPTDKAFSHFLVLPRRLPQDCGNHEKSRMLGIFLKTKSPA
ncbi:hypothetical protein [Burkholderia plantarii]|uniref:hypothetical protein n=1 Tax=Burkholderia plantarii TaxID=41899 RepID=UPI00114CF2E0|nr:hypothetical protein [Burkholderia plantarii]